MEGAATGLPDTRGVRGDLIGAGAGSAARASGPYGHEGLPSGTSRTRRGALRLRTRFRRKARISC